METISSFDFRGEFFFFFGSCRIIFCDILKVLFIGLHLLGAERFTHLNFTQELIE